MNFVKGDKVIVIAGRDKGKTGTIQKVIPEKNRVVVEGVNVRKKHNKHLNLIRSYRCFPTAPRQRAEKKGRYRYALLKIFQKSAKSR